MLSSSRGAQAKTRRLERWETNVSHLHSLLAHELRHAVTRFDLSAMWVRTLRTARGDPQRNQDWVLQRLEQHEAEHRANHDALDVHVRRMSEAGGVVRSMLDQYSVTGANLWLHEARVEGAILIVSTLPDETDVEASKAALTEAWDAIDAYKAIIEPIAKTMKVPRLSKWVRATGRVRRSVARLRKAITRQRATTSSEETTSAEAASGVVPSQPQTEYAAQDAAAH